MPERHSFTGADDNHLIEYIAKNNPEVSGRLGNKLYQTLVENPKRWPWSKSHTWHSWRERYKKNKEWFDPRIKQYLRGVVKEKQPGAGPSNQVSSKAGASSQAGRIAAKRKEESGFHPSKGHKDTTECHDRPVDNVKVPSSSRYAKPSQRVPASHQDEETVSETEESTDEDEPCQPNGEDDYMHELFGSSTEEEEEEGDVTEAENPPASTAPSSPASERIFPDPFPLGIAQEELLVQDSFDTRTKSVRPLQDPTLSQSTTKRHPGTPSSPPVRHPTGPHGEKRLLKRKVPDEDPFLDNTSPPSSPTPGLYLATRKAPPVLNEGPFRNHYVQTRNPTGNESPVVWPPSRNGKEKTKAADHRVAGTEEPPAKRKKSVHNTLESNPTSSPVAIFNDSPRNVRAHNERVALRHIDFRESLKKSRRRFGKSSLLGSRATTASISNSISNHVNQRDSVASSASHHRLQFVSSEEDVEFISLFERDLRELGEKYGFTLGVVKQTYLLYGTLEKTVIALQAFNTLMKGAQDKLYEEIQRYFDRNGKGHDTDDEELIPAGLTPKHAASRGKGKEKESGEQNSHDKRPRQSLNYKPLTTSVEDQSYSPPPRTRAGRYTKLQKKGLDEEALVAASGGTRLRKTTGWLALHGRNESGEEKLSSGRDLQRVTKNVRGTEPSLPLYMDPHHSPVPDEDFVALNEAERQVHEEEEEEDNDNIELTTTVSPDRREVRDPTPEPEQVDDKELFEHKKLCSEATLGNQDILRAFEDEHDGDLLRERGGEWIKERLTALKEAQELRRHEYHQTELEKVKKAEEGGYEP